MLQEIYILVKEEIIQREKHTYSCCEGWTFVEKALICDWSELSNHVSLLYSVSPVLTTHAYIRIDAARWRVAFSRNIEVI